MPAAAVTSDPVRADSPSADPGTPVGRGSESSRGLLALRLAIGIVWSLNLIFIVDPANGFFSGFASTADSFASQSIGGAMLPELVAAHPQVFAALIAAVTASLAVAFLLGVAVRWACGLGILFASVLLITQFNGTFVIPGGTDVGPMPLYIGIYLALLWGRADRLGPLWTLVAPRHRAHPSGRVPRPQGLSIRPQGLPVPRDPPGAREPRPAAAGLDPRPPRTPAPTQNP
ncbi:MAG: DoxX family protein [Thermoplasmata archaeon]